MNRKNQGELVRIASALLLAGATASAAQAPERSQGGMRELEPARGQELGGEEMLRAPRFERLNVAARVPAVTRDGIRVGTWLEPLIDPASGRIEQWTIELQGVEPALRSVPIRMIERDEAGLVLLASEDELDTLAVPRVPGDASLEGRAQPAAYAKAQAGPLPASQLIGLELRNAPAGGPPELAEPQGRLQEIWIQPGRNQVALIAIGELGSDTLVVPWQAIRVHSDAAQDGAVEGTSRVLLLQLEEAELAEAPRFQGSLDEVLSDRGSLERIYGHYGLPVPLDPIDPLDARG